jgi:uncharacterized protein (DUF488 family)
MQPEMRPTIVLTIGHSNRSIDEFLTILLAHKVTLVVDVRKMPGPAKNPQFNQELLSDSLNQKGIEYVHIPGLGGLRRPMRDSPNTGWRNRSFQAFADYMSTADFQQNLDDLISRAASQRTAIMCAEAVPWRCHRSLIADALLVRNISVEDVYTARRAQPHQLTIFAKVDGTRITYPPETDDAI